MKYFTLQECAHSDMAAKRGIDNTPSQEHMDHIVESVDRLLDPLREAWGAYCKNANLGTAGIMISSGYCGPKLNAVVGGPKSSAHCYGYAFDLVPSNRKKVEFKRFCRDFLRDRLFDQLISEEEDSNGIPRWMHVGYKRPNGEQRKQFLSMKDNHYFPMTE